MTDRDLDHREMTEIVRHLLADLTQARERLADRRMIDALYATARWGCEASGDTRQCGVCTCCGADAVLREWYGHHAPPRPTPTPTPARRATQPASDLAF